jgi:large subunit ribosomal protein L21
MYALVEIKGKQYKAEQGATLKVDHICGDQGAALEFPSVLMVSDGSSVKIGAPYISGAVLKAVLKEQGKDAKVLIGKFKKKKNYRRRNGHRQQYSLITVESIQVVG